MSASVFALIVVIEEYGEPKWKLSGATADAFLVTQELLRLGVPPENVRVFLSPVTVAQQYPFPAIVRVAAGTRETIEEAITNELSQRKEEWLFLFWGGHGVVQSDHFRRVFYGDATTAYKKNLDLDDLLRTLRSGAFPPRTLMNQVIVVDACGNQYASLNATKTLPEGTLPKNVGGEVEGRKQWFLLSSAPHEKAAHVAPVAGAALAATGLYTAAFLEQLKTVAAWPPNFEDIADGLRRDFAQRRAEGTAAQTPSLFFSEPAGNGYNLPIVANAVEASRASPAIARAIAALPIFRDAASRELLLSRMPWPVAGPAVSTEAEALCVACCTQPFGFEALLDVCEELGATGLTQFAEVLDLTLPTYGVRWVDCVNLRASLRAAGPLPDDAEAARAFAATPAGRERDAASRGVPPAWARGRLFLFQIFRLSAYVPAGQSLLAFLELCRPHGSAAMGAAIDQWRAAIIARLPPEALQASVPAEARGPGALQIQFQPQLKGGFLCTPWWRTGSKLELTEKLFEPEEIAPGDWQVAVNRAFEEALERNPDGDPFCVEVILPLRFFESEIDAWPIANGAFTSPLGSQYPVVVRPYERIHEKRYRQPQTKWLRKWKQWRAAPGAPRVEVAARPADFVPDLYRNLEQHALGFLAFTLDAGVPPAPTLPPRDGVIETMIAAGVPIALWWRAAPGEDSAPFAKWLIQQDPETWPEKIREYRSGEHRGVECPAGEWPPLTLLWDSPDHLPPDYQHRAQAPTQRLSI